jgi:hypothetical protein
MAEMDDDQGVEYEVFNAEISGQSRFGLDNLLLIEGVKWKDPLHSRIFIGACIIAVVIVAVTLLSTGLRSSSQTTFLSPITNAPSLSSLPPFDKLSPEEEKIISQSSRAVPTGGNTSLTIANSLFYGIENEFNINFIPSGKLFVDILNRTDSNFTLFGVMRDASILDAADWTFVSTMIQPLWSGHLVRSINLPR